MYTNVFDEFINRITKNNELTEKDRAIVLKNLSLLKDTKVNILITGATGCGKSSTINALFNSDKAKVGVGVDPETMDIQKYALDNIVLYDSPGLGDGKDADRRHAKNIIDKLVEKNADGDLLIDLVLVLIDGSSRDYGTAFELINNVIIPNLGDDTSRLLVAINQADVAMKGRYWNHDKNEPEQELVDFLNDKVLSTQKRIKEATGVDTTPIYYSAGYKDGDEQQNPYNLSKLLAHILRHTKREKRAVFMQDLNKNDQMWEKDDELEDYKEEIKKTFIDSVVDTASKGAEIGAEIGKIFGAPGEAVGRVVGTIGGAIWGGLKSLFG